MTEPDVAEIWMFSTLSNDSVLLGMVSAVRMYAAAPSDTFPIAVVGLQTPSLDIVTQPMVRVASRLRYQAKGIVQGNDFAAAGAIAARIDQLLQAQSGTNVGGVVAACYRDQPLRYLEETEQGVQYAHSGGLYRLIVQAAGT